jgi:hypothetical protein
LFVVTTGNPDLGLYEGGVIGFLATDDCFSLGGGDGGSRAIVFFSGSGHNYNRL